MIDKSSLLKSQDSLHLEFISKDGLFHKMLLLSLMGFLTGWCNLKQCGAASGIPELAVSFLMAGKSRVHAIQLTEIKWLLVILDLQR